MNDMTDEEVAERSTAIGADLCGHLEEAYPDDHLAVLGLGALHAAVVHLVMAGFSVDDIVELTEDHAKSFEERYDAAGGETH